MSDSNKQLHSSKYYQERFSLFWPIEKIFIFRKVTAGESLIHFFHTATFRMHENHDLACLRNKYFCGFDRLGVPSCEYHSPNGMYLVHTWSLQHVNEFPTAKSMLGMATASFDEEILGFVSNEYTQNELFFAHHISGKVAVWKKWIKLSPAVTLRKIYIFSIGQNRENRSW